jgi:hypothetical protein
VKARPPTTNLQFVDQRDEVAVAAHDGEGVDVIVGEGHLQGVQGEVDVGAVLVAARRDHALHHLHGVFRHLPLGLLVAPPVGVSELGHDVATFLERVQHHAHVEVPFERGFHADLDVVVINEDGDLEFVLHVAPPRRAGAGRAFGRWPAIFRILLPAAA